MMKHVDKKFFWLVALLFVGGMLILSSASNVLSERTSGTFYFYTLRQLLNGVVGIAFFFLAASVPYKKLRKLGVPLMILSFIFLALLFIPQLGLSHGGARRWLFVGPINFQPSEILKLSLVIYLASWLDARRSDVKSISYGLLPFSLILSLVGVFLIMQPDIGTLLVILATAGIMYLVGGGRPHQVATLALAGFVLLFLLVQVAPPQLISPRIDRILVYLNPGYEQSGAGYQIYQSLIAIGSGGFFGKGFGMSVQKSKYLPEPMGDSIFAVFLEEMGFLGGILLVGAFTLFLWWGMAIAKDAPDTFGKLLAVGLTVSIVLQAFINMAAISGLLPLTGVPLPFVSYGGTSLVVTLLSAGMLLNISKST